MENNAIVIGRFIDILNVMDARTILTVFVEKNGKQERYGDHYVYELLAKVKDETNGFYQIKRYDVIGLNVGLSTSILLRKGD